MSVYLVGNTDFYLQKLIHDDIEIKKMSKYLNAYTDENE